MSLYSALCEVSGSLAGNGNSHASANGNGNVTQDAPYAWTAPESFEVTEETAFSWFASPYNADDIGIVPLQKNEVESVVEVSKQLPPSFYYEGPLGGAGPLGLLAPKPGSAEYNAYVTKQKAKEKYNPEISGITPLIANEKTSAVEIEKQTKGTHLWEQFTTGFTQGYTEAPEDVNVFEKSVSDVGKALTGVVSPSNYYLLGIAGAVLLLILIIK